MRPRRLPCSLLLLIGVVIAASIGGCAGGSGQPGPLTSSTPPSTPATGPPAVSGTSGPTSRSSGAAPSSRRTGSNVLVGSDDNFCAVISAQWGKLSGRSVRLDIGALPGSGDSGTPVEAMERSLSGFVACTGVAVAVTSDPTLETHLRQDALNGTAPDLAVVDGPSRLASLASTGTLAPAPPLVQADLDKLWDAGWRSAGTVNGVLYASPLDVAAAGLVWYSPARFAAWGYQVPTTWDELTALGPRAAKAGHGWCFSTDRGPALRDWLAEILLRQAGTQVYDAWAAGTMPFTDPTVSQALSTVGSLLGLPASGPTSPMSPTSPTSPAAAGSPAAGGAVGATDVVTGRCGMMLAGQGWSMTAPTGTAIGPTGGLYAFPLPPIAARGGTPMLVDGDLLVAFADRPEVQALRYFLSTAYWAGEQYVDTGRISANRGLEVTDIADPIARLTASLLQSKTAVSRFDAFAGMPAAVETAAATQLGAWAAKRTTGDAALAAIAASWPAS